MTDWKIGSDGPMCTAYSCKQQRTYIGTIDHNNGRKKGWPVLICVGHDVGVMAGGRPQSLAGINTTCPSPEYDVASGYWYLPRKQPYYTWGTNNKTVGVVGRFDWDILDWEVGMILRRGKKQYELSQRSLVEKIRDWFMERV